MHNGQPDGSEIAGFWHRQRCAVALSAEPGTPLIPELASHASVAQGIDDFC